MHEINHPEPFLMVINQEAAGFTQRRCVHHRSGRRLYRGLVDVRNGEADRVGAGSCRALPATVLDMLPMAGTAEPAPTDVLVTSARFRQSLEFQEALPVDGDGNKESGEANDRDGE